LRHPLQTPLDLPSPLKVSVADRPAIQLSFTPLVVRRTPGYERGCNLNFPMYEIIS
jgi:hypothetical protein